MGNGYICIKQVFINFMILFKLNKGTVFVVLVVAVVCLAGFLTAYIYYSSKNKAEDPRVVENKFRFLRYDKFMQENKPAFALMVLDTIEFTFAMAPGYSDSYEIGIVYNNRSSVYITRALYQTSDSVQKQILLDSALHYSLACIDWYNAWNDKYGNLNKETLMERTMPFFKPSDPVFEGRNAEKIVKKRVEDILLAQKELARRFSVAYTNLGIVQRHKLRLSEAVESYTKALKLWKDNPSALSNLNVLMGKPPKDRSVIDKLFPPDKNKF